MEELVASAGSWVRPWDSGGRQDFTTESQCSWGFPGGSASAGGTGSIPGLGTSPEKGMATHSNVLAWRIPMDRGAWQATVHGVSKSDTTQVT